MSQIFGNGKNKCETTVIGPMETIRREPKTEISVPKK